MNSARSALSSVILLDKGSFGSHPDVKLFLKGIFNLRPTQTCYITTWDPTTVLEFLETWTPASELSLEKLTMKTIMLIMLSTGQRPQILTKLNLKWMKHTTDTIEFALSCLDVKQGRPNFKMPSILIKAFTANLSATHSITEEGYYCCVFGYQKTLSVASLNMLSRWLKQTLAIAGVDTDIFLAGST
jgi:hypothetical protein